MENNYTCLEDGTLVPSIPEPFCYRGSIWTLFRWHPVCLECIDPKTGKSPLHLKDRAAWQEHYIKAHSVDWAQEVEAK